MNKNIKLVLSGSGILYPCFAGSLLRLAEEGYNITEVCGTSGGAIVAAAIASGYRLNEELIKLVKNTLPAKNNLIDYSVLSLVFNMGLIKGDRIEALFNNYFAKTFKESKIPLHIVTTNIERRAVRVFSTKEDPDTSIALAVRASMSIPGVFAPVKIQDELYVDGGVTGNFMLDLFGAGQDVIGLRFGPYSSASSNWKDSPRIPIRNPADYIGANIESMLEASTREHMDDASFARTIFMRSKYGVLNFNINDKDVDIMKKEGYDCTDRWLKKNK